MWYFLETVGKKLFDLFLTLSIIVMLIMTGSAILQKADGIHHPKFFGYGVGLILGGSMEPTISNGTIGIIKEQDTYAVGDIVTFTDKQDRSITHRIIEIDGDQIKTQGDANKLADPTITQSQIAGKVIFMFSSTYLIIFLCAIQIIAVLAIMWPMYGE